MTNKKTYKRSWRNLLLDKRYQLRFTLFMVGISAILIAALGFWVMDQASSATQTAENNLHGSINCDSLEVVETTPVVIEDIGDVKPNAPAPSGGDAGTPGAANGASDAPRKRNEVVMGETTMDTKEIEQAAPTPAVADEKTREAQAACEQNKAARIEELRSGERRILQYLILVGALLLLGLGAYGIKMTHKVAGPLFKVTLYLNKMRDNKFSEVYNLRKGDHLFEFYEHFKSAHQGVVELQKSDLEQLTRILAAAEEAQLKEKSAELREAVLALEKLKAEKEDSLA